MSKSLKVLHTYHLASLSDHCAAFLDLQINFINDYCKKFQHNSYWKLNTSILHDPDFLPTFSGFWSEILKSQNGFHDIADWWNDAAKPSIKQFCICYSRHYQSTQRDTIKFLLSMLKTVLAAGNRKEVTRIKEELKIIHLKRSYGLVIRSRFNQNAEEERASLYHAAKEATNDKNNISSLKINGAVVKDQGVIEDTVTSFFHTLFNGFHNEKLENTRSYGA